MNDIKELKVQAYDLIDKLAKAQEVVKTLQQEIGLKRAEILEAEKEEVSE